MAVWSWERASHRWILGCATPAPQRDIDTSILPNEGGIFLNHGSDRWGPEGTKSPPRLRHCYITISRPPCRLGGFATVEKCRPNPLSLFSGWSHICRETQGRSFSRKASEKQLSLCLGIRFNPCRVFFLVFFFSCFSFFFFSLFLWRWFLSRNVSLDRFRNSASRIDGVLQ